VTSSAPGIDRSKDDNDGSSTIVIVAASLAAVLFVALIVLAVVLLLRRRKRRGHGKGERLGLRMSHSFKSSDCSSGMMLFCNVSRRRGNPQVADHLYRKVISYNSSRYLNMFLTESVNRLVG